MTKLANYINDKNGFIIKLRMYDEFDENDYLNIKNTLIDIIPEWKKTGVISTDDFSAMIDLIDQLSGGCIYWSEEVSLKVQEANMELINIIHEKLDI